MPIGSARAFGERCAKAGSRVDDMRDLQVGDYVIFWRGSRGGDYGHIGIVESVEVDGVIMIEGNAGGNWKASPPRPSVVRRRLVRWGNPKFLHGARLP